MDRLTSFTTFVGIVNSGGFSAAGRKLNMSTTMVSNHMQALEERLGARLLNRTTRKVSLTDVGRVYYERCTQILADLEEADDMASALQSAPRGTLHVYVATPIVPFVAPVVTEFLMSYSEVKVDLGIGQRIIDLIDEGIDILITLVRPNESRLIVRSLATWQHVLCCAPSYIEKHGRPEQLLQLAERNCVRHSLYPFADEWRFVGRTGTPAAVRVSGNLISDSGETLRRAALDGIGIALAAGFLVHEDLVAGRLVRLLPDYRPVELSMNVIYPHRHHLSAKVRTFIDMLVRHSAEQQKIINPYSA